MIQERVEVVIHEGREDEFERAMAGGREILSQAAGCLSVKLARGVERPNRYLLLLEWNSVEDHVAFTTTEPFADFRTLAGPFFSEKPAMEHFRPIG
ncbi:MAG: antibiotic biosynthesis monooxygenase family protein [Gammaproteobacteria bacterium]